MSLESSIFKTVYASLLAGLIAVGAYIAFPIGPVPIVLQNFFVLLTGLLIGAKWGTGAVCLYLLAGALGLPVFAGGTCGLGRFLGPTGGYLIGYVPAVYIVGFISEKGNKKTFFDVLGMCMGTLIIYAVGILWLKLWTGLSFAKTLTIGFYPFFIGDALKIVAAAIAAKAIRPIMLD